MRGLFIALEGGEGAGKSSLASALGERARAAGREVLLAREPGGTSFGDQVRRLLHDDLSPWAEAFAFLAARAQLVDRVIRPALESGTVVICDRYAASTFAYQGHGRGLDLASLRVANQAATGGLTPDLIVFLDLEPAEGLARKAGEGEAVRIGREGLAFHERVREGYRQLAAEATPGSWVTIDAGKSSAEVLEASWRVVGTRLSRRRLDDAIDRLPPRKA